MLRKSTLLLFSWLLAVTANAQQPDDLAGRLDWSGIATTAHQMTANESAGVIEIQTTGGDPYFWFQMPPLPPSSRDWMLSLEYFCAPGISSVEWRTRQSNRLSPAAALPAMPPAEGWTTYSANLSQLSPDSISPDQSVTIRMDLGSRSGIRLQVRKVRVRPINERELALAEQAEQRITAKQHLADQIRQYRNRNWPARIDSVTFAAGQIRVVGQIAVDQGGANPPIVVARKPSASAATPPSAAELARTWAVTWDRLHGDSKLNGDRATRGFTAQIPATANSPLLRSGVRFQLFRGSNTDTAGVDATDAEPNVSALSAAVYRSVDVPDQAPDPPRSLQAAKGLTCITSRFTVDQLRDLGLEHASVNLVMTGLVSDREHRGWPQTTIGGRKWWINEPKLRSIDGDVRAAWDAGIVVAGILLIPNSTAHPSPLAHPQADPAGTYAMPNLDQDDAVALYQATLNVLADRYGRGDPQHGRIDHWIVHNEIDYGWQWTNMGEQPMEVFMDHYVRSMRLVDAAVRQINPHARVFISLTHRWNATDCRHWKTYPPKQMLQWLCHDSQLEGDFPWGVAYHPYPQSLWKSDTWNDNAVSDDFDTPLITIKNLTVLDRWMHLPSSRTHDGQVRPVICSEQGFHADPADPKQLDDQAAALLYTWQQLRQCPSILAFDYHRPSDHPGEGGLKLGLRGLPTRGDRLGKPKPAWDVYRAIGTDREAELRDHYQPLWK
ncbi:DUF5722 domain-containing protein [Stieleria sp. TO1_6]|uniref:DUF5722 domain-containing protein n=1 Tax=Stieleria tagensis TaxID=2956795 RepID=UPI00209B222C|nr:DUF5722 domain-containing protein [Stieleria tagensis]MCO8122443.1 DUF5722 domain-containing protein [Stieleria tagensis]